MKISPAIKQGIYLAVYLFIIGTFLTYALAYLGTINAVASILGAGAITVGLILAVFGFIFGFILWYITKWVSNALKFRNPAIIQGILVALGSLLSLNLIGIVVGFATGYILWWLSEKW